MPHQLYRRRAEAASFLFALPLVTLIVAYGFPPIRSTPAACPVRCLQFNMRDHTDSAMSLTADHEYDDQETLKCRCAREILTLQSNKLGRISMENMSCKLPTGYRAESSCGSLDWLSARPV